ncbi:MAG: DUF2271 domain-containing protein [Spirochaetaceae bacterium]|nr:DUF2271 domain-containing protein [Spirochaetaceae bacterium]
MKKFFVALVLLGALIRTGGFAQPVSGALEISLVYTRQGGFGSNQFAVWITDARGNYVKTLYATRFTASGGYSKRPQSIPTWVEQSGLARMSRAQVDAFTGATPPAGALVYRWDGTDHTGAALPRGEYRVYVEGSLRNETRVLYSASVQWGSPARPVELQPRYFGNDTRARNMISAVKVSFIP